MTAFSITQPFAGDGGMTGDGRFLPHAPQHHGALAQGRAERQEPTLSGRARIKRCYFISQSDRAVAE